MHINIPSVGGGSRVDLPDAVHHGVPEEAAAVRHQGAGHPRAVHAGHLQVHHSRTARLPAQHGVRQAGHYD